MIFLLEKTASSVTSLEGSAMSELRCWCSAFRSWITCLTIHENLSRYVYLYELNLPVTLLVNP